MNLHLLDYIERDLLNDTQITQFSQLMAHWQATSSLTEQHQPPAINKKAVSTKYQKPKPSMVSAQYNPMTPKEAFENCKLQQSRSRIVIIKTILTETKTTSHKNENHHDSLVPDNFCNDQTDPSLLPTILGHLAGLHYFQKEFSNQTDVIHLALYFNYADAALTLNSLSSYPLNQQFECKVGQVEDLQIILENDFSISDNDKDNLIKFQGPLIIGPFPILFNENIQEIESFMRKFGAIEQVHFNQNRFATIHFTDVRSNEAALKFFEKQGGSIKAALSGKGYMPPIKNSYFTGFLNPWSNFQVPVQEHTQTQYKDTVYELNPLPKNSFLQNAIATPPASTFHSPGALTRLSSTSSSYKHLIDDVIKPNYLSNPSPLFKKAQPRISQQKLLTMAQELNHRLKNNNTNDGITDYISIATRSDKRTTLMIRNIPNKYTQEMLIDHLNTHVFSQYNFLYLRMDFVNECNVGYAFIDFVDTSSIVIFAHACVGLKWPCFNSDKVCQLSYANIQGLDLLIEKFRNSTVMLEKKSYRPMVFVDGNVDVFPGCTEEVKKTSVSGRKHKSSKSMESHTSYGENEEYE